MSKLKYNGVEYSKMKYNGTTYCKWKYNGVVYDNCITSTWTYTGNAQSGNDSDTFTFNPSDFNPVRTSSDPSANNRLNLYIAYEDGITINNMEPAVYYDTGYAGSKVKFSNLSNGGISISFNYGSGYPVLVKPIKLTLI